MSIFKKIKKEHIIIVGCGRFGTSIVEMLKKQNKSIAIIDIDENSFIKLSPSFNLLSIIGDGTDTDLLEIAGAKNANILIASTNDDDTNIMIAQIAKQVYHIQTVIARIYDSSKEISFNDMNIMAIYPELLSTKECCKIVANEENKAL